MGWRELHHFGPAATKVAVCEKGHVDDHHLEGYGRCSRCGGATQTMQLDGLAADFISERTARREAEAELATELAEERIMTQALIAAVAEHERDAQEGNHPSLTEDHVLWDRVRSISQGDSE